MTYHAYIHFKPDGTPFYVGKGGGRRVASVNRPHNTRHTRTVHKYGAGSILIGSWECSSDDIAIQLEIGLIKRLRMAGVDLANNTNGGDGTVGNVRTPEQCRANGDRKIGNQNMRGKNHTLETRQQMSASRLKYWEDPEKRNLQSQKRTGKIASEYSRKKMSEARKGLKWITNGTENRQIERAIAPPEGWKEGRVILKKYERKSGQVKEAP